MFPSDAGVGSCLLRMYMMPQIPLARLKRLPRLTTKWRRIPVLASFIPTGVIREEACSDDGLRKFEKGTVGYATWDRSQATISITIVGANASNSRKTKEKTFVDAWFRVNIEPQKLWRRLQL